MTETDVRVGNVRYFDMPRDEGPPVAEKMLPVTNPELSRYDKPKGGLWTSPVESEYGWVHWCNDEMPHWLNKSWILVPRADVRLLRVDSAADLDAAFARYPIEGERTGHLERNLDFERMSLDFDGFWLTTDGHFATRLRMDAHYDAISTYVWDCETVFWFRWCFEEVHAEAG